MMLYEELIYFGSIELQTDIKWRSRKKSIKNTLNMYFINIVLDLVFFTLVPRSLVLFVGINF